MEDPNETFRAAFHNLGGITVGEKYKNLSCLLNRVTTNVHLYNLDTLIPSIKPKNVLEETLKVHTIIHFKIVPEMIQVLKTENWILISKILKQKWFYKELASNHPPESLLDLLGNVSFVVRTKLLNRLADNVTDTDYVDRLLELFISKYGVENCTYLLTGCSPDKIRQTLSEYGLDLKPAVLLRLAKKDPDLVIFYADICKDKNSNSFSHNDDLVLNYFITNNFEAFLKIHEKHGNMVHCGKRTTRRLVEYKKELLLGNAKRFDYFLNKKGIVKGLRSDFVTFYCQILPDTVDDLRRCFDEEKFFKYILLLPKKTQAKITDEAFNKKWNTSLLKETRLLSPKLIDKFYGADERINFTKMSLSRMEDGEDGDIDKKQWIKYLDTETAVELLKKKISLTTEVYEKRDLVDMLVQTCYVNKDEGALLEVCKYFVNRHRNENPTIKMSFLSEIMNSFQTEILSEKHWEYLEKIMCMIESSQQYYYGREKFLLQNTVYCVKNSLPPNKYVEEFCRTTNTFTLKAEAEVVRNGLLFFYNLIPEVFKEDITNRIDAYLKLFASVIEWNEKHPLHKININEQPLLIEALLDENSTRLKREILEYVICKNDEFFKEKEPYINLYFKKYEFLISHKINLWLLRNRPESVQKHVQVYSAHFYPTCEYYWCKKYAGLSIPQTLSKKSTNMIQESGTDVNDCARTLSVLLNVDEFSQIISKYYPTDSKVDLRSEAAQLMYNIQRAIAANLKFSQPPSSALALLMNFCCGDYLRSALESLYCLFYNTTEDKLGAIVENLCRRAVSVRKHTIFLADKIFSKQKAGELFKWFIQNEGDASVRKYLFKTVVKFFTRNPCDEIWQIIKTNISALHKNDEEAFDLVVDNKSVPKEYWAKYVEFAWSTLKRNEENGSTLNKHKFTLIRNIPSSIFKTLNTKFCDDIIKGHFTEAQEFAIAYLIHSPPEQIRMRLNTVFDVVLETRRQNVKSKESFVNDFCRKAIGHKSKECLVEFEQMWTKKFVVIDDFDDYLCLQITLMHFNTTTTSYIQDLGVNLAQFLDLLTSEYGIAVVDVFVESLNKVLWSCLENTNNLEDSRKIELTRSFYKASGSSATALAAIKLIQELNLDVDDVCKESTIFEDLRNKTEPIVQIYLGQYLNELIVY